MKIERLKQNTRRNRKTRIQTIQSTRHRRQTTLTRMAIQERIRRQNNDNRRRRNDQAIREAIRNKKDTPKAYTCWRNKHRASKPVTI